MKGNKGIVTVVQQDALCATATNAQPQLLPARGMMSILNMMQHVLTTPRSEQRIHAKLRRSIAEDAKTKITNGNRSHKVQNSLWLAVQLHPSCLPARA